MWRKEWFVGSFFVETAMCKIKKILLRIMFFTTLALNLGAGLAAGGESPEEKRTRKVQAANSLSDSNSAIKCLKSFDTKAKLKSAHTTDLNHYHGYLTAVLVETTGGQKVLSIAAYLMMDAHEMMIRTIKELGHEIKTYLFLGEIFMDTNGVTQIINTAGYTRYLPFEIVRNSPETFIKALREYQPQLGASQVDIRHFNANEPQTQHLDPRFSEFGSANVRHEINNVLNSLKLSMVLVLLSVEKNEKPNEDYVEILKTYSHNFRTMLPWVDIQFPEEPKLVDKLSRLLERIDQPPSLPSLEVLKEAQRLLDIMIENLKDLPVLVLTI